MGKREREEPKKVLLFLAEGDVCLSPKQGSSSIHCLGKIASFPSWYNG